MPAFHHYYSNPLGSISYDLLGFVCLTWTDAAIEPDLMQSLYAHTLQALKHYDTCRLLTDQRRRPLPEHEQGWIVEQWIPAALAQCIHSHCAILESPDAGSWLAARAVSTGSTGPLHFAYFQQEEDARQWLYQA
ncbi:hypothetical protein EJV47_24635 [Hymenobacter gummosus]|uniref:STAS/SEC14 domain-containing protein n=1 Tax=Hymenobacter gummosus TaxID=1776032 RepID=A0A431TWA4_9BACT|nr:STAS/SEC14 domain-containing protein [Hymenobacter gummosus]RTQ45676.1 hypothetical protein EJV47_24635 [Hymenobacter gummosus]